MLVLIEILLSDLHIFPFKLRLYCHDFPRIIHSGVVVS